MSKIKHIPTTELDFIKKIRANGDEFQYSTDGINYQSVGGGGSVGYTIAAPNAVEPFKSRADLILTGVPTDDLAAINGAITMLHTARASTEVAIRIDFLGGNIDIGTKTDGSAIVIPLGCDNIHLYGNGVKITGNVYDIEDMNAYSVVDISGNNCILDGFDIDNSGVGIGLHNAGTDCTITGNTCDGGLYALDNRGNNCTITGNTCIGEYGIGLSNAGTDCTITGNTCIGSGSSEYSIGLSNAGTDCTITGNTCSSRGKHGLDNRGSNCIISGNTCDSGLYALDNRGNNCTITGNTCSVGNYGIGLHNAGTDCTITGNTCDGGVYGSGLECETTDTMNKCLIIGNVCIVGGISVKTGTCLPATKLAMEDVNTGVVTLRP